MTTTTTTTTTTKLCHLIIYMFINLIEHKIKKFLISTIYCVFLYYYINIFTCYIIIIIQDFHVNSLLTPLYNSNTSNTILAYYYYNSSLFIYSAFKFNRNKVNANIIIVITFRWCYLIPLQIFTPLWIEIFLF